MNEYERYDGLGLAELVRTRQVSAEELLEVAIERIERLNPRVNAVVQRMYDQARAAIRAGLPEGPFTGVPFLLKDLNALYAGTVTTHGSAVFRDAVADHDSGGVAVFRGDGMGGFGLTAYLPGCAGPRSVGAMDIDGDGSPDVVVTCGDSSSVSVFMGGGTGSRLTIDDVNKLQKNSTRLAGVSPMMRMNAQVIGSSGNWSTSIFGVSPDYLVIRQWTLSSGDFFAENDVKGMAKVCVIGWTVSTNVFGESDPVGRQIRIRDVPFRVIGLLAQKGVSAGGQDQDDQILVPYTTMNSRLNKNRFINSILCSAISPDQMEAAQDEIRSILRDSHKLTDTADDDFTVRNQADVISTAKQTTDVLTAFLASIAGISLLVGGVGIMNIMLVSVTERTREIGIRMAIGARGADIRAQFLVEAVVLCVSGGIFGITLGFLLSVIIQVATGWLLVFSLPMVILAFLFSLLVGVFFGYYPASRASALNPIEALRYE